MRKDNNLYDKSYAFAVRVVKLYQYLIREHNEYVMSKQILRSGTSIGANIAEANGGISTAEFSAKLSISYKECLEIKFWLTLLKDTGYLRDDMFESLFRDADEVGKILYSSIRTTRFKSKENKEEGTRNNS